MTLDALLRAHGVMKVQRPPELWEADTEDIRFVPLLGEMIAAAVAGGGQPAELTLNASNVVVEDGDRPAPGEYVAVTVSGRIDLGADAVWPPAGPSAQGLLGRIHDRLVAAGVTFAYVRRVPSEGSVTVFLRRARPPM